MRRGLSWGTGRTLECSDATARPSAGSGPSLPTAGSARGIGYRGKDFGRVGPKRTHHIVENGKKRSQNSWFLQHRKRHGRTSADDVRRHRDSWDGIESLAEYFANRYICKDRIGHQARWPTRAPKLWR